MPLNAFPYNRFRLAPQLRGNTEEFRQARLSGDYITRKFKRSTTN
jgi:hypothetical protein